jgi:hypothetical protein
MIRPQFGAEPALAPDPKTTFPSWKARSRSAEETATTRVLGEPERPLFFGLLWSRELFGCPDAKKIC